MALAFGISASLHRVARFLISGNTRFALPFFTWPKACCSLILLRALPHSQVALGLGVVVLILWLLLLDRQN